MGNSGSSTTGNITNAVNETEAVGAAPEEPSPETAGGQPSVSVAGADNDDRRRKRLGDDSGHALRSSVKGQSDIETLARAMEERNNNRIVVTFGERKEFLTICYEAAKSEGGSPSRFSKSGLQTLIDEYQEKVSKKENSVSSGFYKLYNGLFNQLGYWDSDKSMLELLQAGMAYVEKGDEDEFYYRDFNFYSLEIQTRFSFMRVPQLAIGFWLFVYYFGSVILFCPIMRNEDVCESGRHSYTGWMSSVYFASVTMSTVGYGDLSLVNGPPWQVFIGVVYMLISIIVGACVFSAAADLTFGGVFGVDMYSWMEKRDGNSNTRELPLYTQIRRIVWYRIIELGTYFILLNALGVFVARAFVNGSGDPDVKWDWMTTIYWAVQTTTTIGYGDLSMPLQLRWFNIFFTTFGTAFVGGVFGSLASLKSEVTDRRNYYAWRRREVSKHMIRELQINDDKLDQYEFMVASLLLLNKIEQSDVEQIMDKFRELAGDKGYVSVEEEGDEKPVDLEEEAKDGKVLLPV